MKIHATNYQNIFIEVAEDSTLSTGETPPVKGDKKSVANLQFDLLYENPYKFTSDDIFFQVHAMRKELLPADLETEQAHFFSKRQPCFRASPLTERYGWGIHSDKNSKVALYAIESEEYQEFVTDDSVKKVKAMRSRRG
jgi:hypothetical protein